MSTLDTALALAEGNENSHKKYICCVYCMSREFTPNTMKWVEAKERSQKKTYSNEFKERNG